MVNNIKQLILGWKHLDIHSLFARSSWLSHICGRSTKIKWMGMTTMHRHSRHRPVIPMQLFLVSFGCFGSKVGAKLQVFAWTC